MANSAASIRPSAGFTLLEALVVLVITGLVSVVLVQGFGLVLGARTSVEHKLVDIDQAVLQQNIFLEPLRGVLPDYPDRPNMFAGEPKQIRALTVRPLQERFGGPVGFTLSMDYDSGRNETVLTYREQGAAPQIVGRWEGDVGAFSYRDRTGDWSSTWPPPGAADTVPQTPWLIRVEKGTGLPETLIASVAGPHRRTLRLMDSPVASAPER